MNHCQATIQSVFERRLASAGISSERYPEAPVWRIPIIDMADDEVAEHLRCVSVLLQVPSAQHALDLLRQANISPFGFPNLDEEATRHRLASAGLNEIQINQKIYLGRLGETMDEFVARFKKDFFKNLQLMERCGQNTIVVVEELLHEMAAIERKEKGCLVHGTSEKDRHE